MMKKQINNNGDMVVSLQNVLQSFDGLKLNNLIENGLDLKNNFIDVVKRHNALHELIINYCSIQILERSPMLYTKLLDMITIILDNGININEVDAKQQTILHTVCTNSVNNSELIDSLITFGCLINQPDDGQQTSLHKAVIVGNICNIKCLLKHKTNVNFLDYVGLSPLHYAVKKKNNEEVINLLVESGADVNCNHQSWNIHSSIGGTPLHIAAYYGRLQNVKLLLKHHANTSIVDSSGQTPLHVAACHDMTGQISEIFAKDHKIVNLHDSLTGETALHKAVQHGLYENVKVLLKNGADPDLVDYYKESAIHKAAVNCTNMFIIKELVLKSKKIDLLNLSEQTALSKAQKYNNTIAATIIQLFDSSRLKVEEI